MVIIIFISKGHGQTKYNKVYPMIHVIRTDTTQFVIWTISKTV